MREPATYGAFENPEVILTTFGDRRLWCLRDDACWCEQACDGPTYLVVRPSATDEQLAKAAARYPFTVDELKAFRATEAR
jgi:hypothetical protein